VNLWQGQSWKKRAGLIAGASVLTLLSGCALGYAVTDVPQPNKIATDQALRLLYADGTEMARFGKNRVLVPLSQVSDAAQHAVLAAEDREFYHEPGISLKGIGRALFTDLKGGGVSQGGSTITQQYAKNAYLTQERTFTRKVKEVFIAMKMSRTVSKDQILEDYLNTIYFGRGAFGIEAAAETYFHVHAKALTVAQSAVLASSIRSPAAYDPARHRARAVQRWGYVLDGMVKERWLTQEQRAAARYPVVLKRSEGGSSIPGDLDHIRDQVVAELQQHGFDEDRIAAGGLVITTTIQRKAQDAAREAMDEGIPAGKGDAPVGALVSVQPGTGKVVAYYGGRDAGGFDYADNERAGVQPGSSMKPYVLATALEEGKHLGDKYDGHSPQEICGQKVSNDEGDPPLGQVDLAKGLALSVNVVYMRLSCEIGPHRVAELAHAAGIGAEHKLGGAHPGAGIALGIYEIHPMDQAVGYATFAAKGTAAKPYFVLGVKDRHGNEVYKAKQETSRAFSEKVAADTTFAMQEVVSDGTGTRAKIPGRPTAGKTGTTQRNTNAWFCGFTPQLATAVWMGRPSGAPLKGVKGAPGGVYGGTIPAKVFRAFMEKALDGQPVLDFPKSEGLSGPSATPSATSSATATPTATAIPTVVVTNQPSLPPVFPTRSPKPSHGPQPTATATPSSNPSPSAAAATP
jgi:membrane peptidoglycan carboxypeptidase